MITSETSFLFDFSVWKLRFFKHLLTVYITWLAQRKKLTTNCIYSYKIVNVNAIAAASQPASQRAKQFETDYVWGRKNQRKMNLDNADEWRKRDFSLVSATEKWQSLNCYLRSFFTRCQFILLHINLLEISFFCCIRLQLTIATRAPCCVIKWNRAQLMPSFSSKWVFSEIGRLQSEPRFRSERNIKRSSNAAN